MDHLARAQRMLELQEAENARVSYRLISCLKRPISCSAVTAEAQSGKNK